MINATVGMRVVHHYCGGSIYGVVVKVNAKSVRVQLEDGRLQTFRLNKVSEAV